MSKAILYAYRIEHRAITILDVPKTPKALRSQVLDLLNDSNRRRQEKLLEESN